MLNSWDKTITLIIFLIGAYLIYLLAPILTPFLVGAILAYLGDPLVTRLTNWGLPRIISVILVFLILFLIFMVLLLVLIPLIEDQIGTLIIVIPNMVEWGQKTIIPWINHHFGTLAAINIDTLKKSFASDWTKAGGVAAWAWKAALHSGYTLLTWLTNLVLIPVVTFYLLRDWDKVVKGIHDLLPRTIEPTVSKITRECDSVLSAFFRGQLLVMLALGIIYSIGLTAIGLQIGLMIGLIAGLVSIVPYLGFIVGITTASIAAMVQFGTWTSVLLVFLVFIIGQAIESMFLTPNLVGDRIGLHPVAVIFAVLAGGSLFGFFGILLALPVAAIIMVLIRFLNKHYRKSDLYRRA